MTDVTAVIPEPEDRSIPPLGVEGAWGEDIDTLNSDVKALDNLEKEITQLYNAKISIENFGIDKSSFAMFKKHGLFEDTALSSLGLESIVDERFGSPESLMALEVLEDKEKEKSAQWAGKILKTISDGVTTVTDGITAIWERVKAAAAPLIEKTWDVGKLGGQTIKAHPYRTILIALGAAAAAFGIVAYIGTGLPMGVVTNGAMVKFATRLQTMYNAIKLPFGKIATSVAAEGRLVLAKIEMTAFVLKEASVTNLGWSTASARAVYTQAERVANGALSGMRSIWNNVVKPAERVLATVLFAPKDLGKLVTEKTGMRSLGWAAEKLTAGAYYSILYKILASAYQFVKTVVSKTLQAVRDTFRTLSSAVA